MENSSLLRKAHQELNSIYGLAGEEDLLGPASSVLWDRADLHLCLGTVARFRTKGGMIFSGVCPWNSAQLVLRGCLSLSLLKDKEGISYLGLWPSPVAKISSRLDVYGSQLCQLLQEHTAKGLGLWDFREHRHPFTERARQEEETMKSPKLGGGKGFQTSHRSGSHHQTLRAKLNCSWFQFTRSP